ncbi:hypothetical protein LY90DRAFT_503440 [Neocallimastix californiae]|uniref:GAR domain-containing protein n=1 Tax=Neocallimastix californiae TaxID=1754190 RepID=A0A1Y2EQD1_9FUNG|nr:hypothetical protein LY90DRAFT_503440 [Neocallimastix californiae]|eukprot:ORY73045.1 hypothetical protein LY90DRAFT_503440 [Neocallimastix californiae]
MSNKLNFNDFKDINKDVQKKIEELDKELNNIIELYYDKFKEDIFYKKQEIYLNSLKKFEDRINKFNKTTNEKSSKDENTQTFINIKKTEYNNDIAFLKGILNSWEYLSEKVHNISEKVIEIKKKNYKNIYFNTYEEFKDFIIKIVKIIVSSRSELEDIKKQLIFDDNSISKNLKYFTSQITNNKILKELKYSLESKYLRLSENLLNDVYIIEKEIPENISIYKKNLKEHEWNNDLKESFRNTIQSEKKLEYSLKTEVKLENLEELENKYKEIVNSCKYINILIESDSEGVYKKRFNSDIDQMNLLLKNIQEKINDLNEFSNEFDMYKNSYKEHNALLNSKNEKLNKLFKQSLEYIENSLTENKKLININNSINNFQKDIFLKYNLFNQEYQQDIIIINQWNEYYKTINNHFEKDNLKTEYKNIISWNENIENNKQEYHNNIKKFEYLNAYLVNINNLLKQKIKNNDYICIYTAQLKSCEEFIKILNSEGISSFLIANIIKCEKKICNVLSTIDRKYYDINKEADNLYEQFNNISNTEIINFLDLFSEDFKIKIENLFLNNEIKIFESILKIRRKQFEEIFNQLKYYGNEINKKGNEIKNKFDYMFCNKNVIFLKAIDESKKISKEKDEYQIYHQKINDMYNDLKKELKEITQKAKNEIKEKWKNLCNNNNNIVVSDLSIIPKEVMNWCYLNIPKSEDLDDMELYIKIENEFNNFVNVFIEKWNNLIDFKNKIDAYNENNKLKKLDENKIKELEESCKNLSNIEITYKHISEILTPSYASISDKDINAIIQVQETMIENFDNVKKNLLIVYNKYIKVLTTNIKNEATENLVKRNIEWCNKKLSEINDYKCAIKVIDLNPIYEMYNCNFGNNFSQSEEYDISIPSLVNFFISSDNKIIKEQNILLNDNYEIISEKKLEFEKFISTILINDFYIEKKQTVIEKYNKLKEDLQDWKIIISDYEMACNCKEYMLNMLFFIDLMDKNLDNMHDQLEISFENYNNFIKEKKNLKNIEYKIHQFNFDIKRNSLEHSKLINFKNKEYIYKDLTQFYKKINIRYDNMKLYYEKINTDYEKVTTFYEKGNQIMNILENIKENRNLIVNNNKLLCNELTKLNENKDFCKKNIENCKKIYNEIISSEIDKQFLLNHGITKYCNVIENEIENIEAYIQNSFIEENILKLIDECDLLSNKIDQNMKIIEENYDQGCIFEVYTKELEDIYNNMCEISYKNYDYIEEYNKKKYKIKDILMKNSFLLKYEKIKELDEKISRKNNLYSNFRDNTDKVINKFKDHINKLKNSKEKLIRINKKINEIYNILSRIEEDPKCAIEQYNGKLNLIKLIDDNCQVLKKIFQTDIYKKYENSLYFNHYPKELLEKFNKIKKLIIYSQLNDKKNDIKKGEFNNFGRELEKHKEEIEIIIDTTVDEYKVLLGKNNSINDDISKRFSEINDIFKNVAKQLQLEWIDLKDNYIDYVSMKNIKDINVNDKYEENSKYYSYLCNTIEKNYKQINSIFHFINNKDEMLNEISNLRKTKEKLFEEFRTCISIYRALENLINNKECKYSDIKECLKIEFKKWRDDIQNYKMKSGKLINFIQYENDKQTKFDEFIDIIKGKIQIDILINNYDKRLNQFSKLFDDINKYYDRFQVNINSLIYILEHHISKENIVKWKFFTINDKINNDFLQEIIDDHSLYESQYKKICNNYERKNNKYLKKIINCISIEKQLIEFGDPINIIPLYVKEKLIDFFTSNGNIWNLKYLNKLWKIENDIYEIILNFKTIFKNIEDLKEKFENKSLSISQFETNCEEKLIQYQNNINIIKDKYKNISESPSEEILKIIELLENKSKDMINELEIKIKKMTEENNIINNSMDKLNDDINIWCNHTNKQLEEIKNDFFLHIVKIPINELVYIKYNKYDIDQGIIKDYIDVCEENVIKNTMNEIKITKYKVDEINFVLNNKQMIINNKINKYKGNTELVRSLNQLENNKNYMEKLEENVLIFNNRYFFTMKMLKAYRTAINILFLIQYSENIIKFCKDTLNNDIKNIKEQKLIERLDVIKNGLLNLEFLDKMNKLKSIRDEICSLNSESEDIINYDFYNKIKNNKNIQKELNSNVKTVQKELSFNCETAENKETYISKFNDIIYYLDNYYSEVDASYKSIETLVYKCKAGYDNYKNIVKSFIDKFDQLIIKTENNELKYNNRIDEILYEKRMVNKQYIVKKIYYSEYVTEILVNLIKFKSIGKEYKSINNLVSYISKKLYEYNNYIDSVENYINYFRKYMYIPRNLRNISKIIIDELKMCKDLLKNITDKKNNLKEYSNIIYNSVEWIKNFDKTEEKKESINDDILKCSTLLNCIIEEKSNKCFNEFYINKIVNCINNSLNYWQEEIQQIEDICKCRTKFPLYKIDVINDKYSNELEKLFIDKISIDTIKIKYYKRKSQCINIKKLLLDIQLKNSSMLENEINLIEKRLNKENFSLWLTCHYDEYLKYINNNEKNTSNFINDHMKSKEMHNYIENYYISLKNLKCLKYESISENDKIEKIPEEIFNEIISKLENETYKTLLINFENLWNIECDFINLIKYNENPYEKLYKLYNEINSSLVKYNKNNNINKDIINQSKKQLEYFKNCNIKLEEDIILNHKQYNKTKEFNDENRQLIDELNNYILDNQKNYLNEIRNLIDSFIKIIKNITNKYEKKCTDIINELINIQIWIQNIQKGLKQYSSNLPPESLFNIIENIISIKKDKELDLDNFYGNINETLKKTFEESNTVIKKCENHYNEINKEVNEKLNIYESIFAEYNNEEKISSLKIPISKSLELLKNDLSEFKDYYISSYKLVDVESKALYLYSKFTYVLYSVKAIKDSLKNSEINVKSLNNLKAKVKEIEEEYLTTTLNLEYNECEDVIKSYNENFYEKTNKKELVNLLISKISKLLNTIQTDTYYKYNKLTNKIKNCSNFIDEYEINEKKLLNINEEVNKINDFSTENNICNFEISDYKKVFNEILININSMDINECETYIKSKNNYKNQNIKGIKILINNYNNILEKTIESIKDCNIEQKLINEIYNNNKALNDVFKIISEIKDLIEEFEKTDETNNKIEKKILFECQFNKLEINFKNYNMIFDIYDKYQESFKYCHKYEKIINKIKVDEDNCENEIKQLKLSGKKY